MNKSLLATHFLSELPTKIPKMWNFENLSLFAGMEIEQNAGTELELVTELLSYYFVLLKRNSTSYI